MACCSDIRGARVSTIPKRGALQVTEGTSWQCLSYVQPQTSLRTNQPVADLGENSR